MRLIDKLKRKKAPGRDGIKNEVWINGTDKLTNRVTEIMNEVWRGEGFPRKWREGVICPIYKKRERKDVRNYRGITLLNTLYKMYAMVLDERLRREIESKGMVPDSQAGFREGRGTIDNVYFKPFN